MSEDVKIAAGANNEGHVEDSAIVGAQDNMDLLNEEGCLNSNEPVEDDTYSSFTLKEIVEKMRGVPEMEDNEQMYKVAESLKSAFYKVLRKEKDASCADSEDEEKAADNYSELFDEIEKEFKNLYSQYKAKRTKYLQDQESQKEVNLECKLAVIEELKSLLEKQEDINQTFPAFRELQARWKEIGPVPQNRMKDVWESYQHQVERFYDYVKINNELRDLDLKRNLDIKTGLCERAEALKDEQDVVEAFKELQKLHEEWRETGPVSKELREEIWNRFKEATSVINKKHQQFFDNLKEERKQNLEKKTALCLDAEMIANKKDIQPNEWNVLSKQMEELQNKWKTIGFAAKKDNQKIYERFREACDKFYNAKREYYAEFKKTMQHNLELKEALCEQAEAIMNSEEWKKVTDQLIKLQKEWKKIGPVARRQSDAVWKRFRAACDVFFNNKAKHFEEVDSEYESNLDAKKSLVEEIKAYVRTGNKDEDTAAMRSFQERWREIGFVPFKEKENIQNMYKEAMDLQFSDIKPSDSENRINRFAKKIKDMQASAKGNAGKRIKSEREKLLQKYHNLESEIKVLENNLGFFAKSKNASQYIADIERKVSEAKAELEQLEQKIKLIDEQYQQDNKQ